PGCGSERRLAGAGVVGGSGVLRATPVRGCRPTAPATAWLPRGAHVVWVSAVGAQVAVPDPRRPLAAGLVGAALPTRRARRALRRAGGGVDPVAATVLEPAADQPAATVPARDAIERGSGTK